MSSFFQHFGQNPLTFPGSMKFPDFSLTGKSFLIFPGFPVHVGTMAPDLTLQFTACKQVRELL